MFYKKDLRYCKAYLVDECASPALSVYAYKIREITINKPYLKHCCSRDNKKFTNVTH